MFYAVRYGYGNENKLQRNPLYWVQPWMPAWIEFIKEPPWATIPIVLIPHRKGIYADGNEYSLFF